MVPYQESGRLRFASQHEPNRNPNPYKEYEPGQTFSFSLKTPLPNGSVVSQDKTITIGAVAGGGFFGKVLLPQDEDFVIKTAVPGSLRHIMRIINNGGELDARVDERTAKMNYLTLKLLHDIVPAITNGEFYTPDVLGYTHLPNGYALAIEKVSGRIPRLDEPFDFDRFADAQAELTDTMLPFGFEHVGQIYRRREGPHKEIKNPLGVANIWRDDKNDRWIWLDAIPAILHNKGFLFPFHDDIRKWFGQQETTFDTLHAGYCKTELTKHREKFTPEEFQRIQGNLDLYITLQDEKARYPKREPNDPAALGLAVAEFAHQIATLDGIPAKLAQKSTIQNVYKFLSNHEYRTNVISGKVILRGIKEAARHGLVSEEDLQQAIQLLTVDGNSSDQVKRQNAAIEIAWASYFITGAIIDIAGASKIASAPFSDNAILTALQGAIATLCLSPLARYATTHPIAMLTKTKLHEAAIVSLSPIAGTWLAPTLQKCIDAGENAEETWHYAVRYAVASIAGVFGGMGSEAERGLWNIVGKPIEQWGTKRIQKRRKT